MNELRTTALLGALAASYLLAPWPVERLAENQVVKAPATIPAPV